MPDSNFRSPVQVVITLYNTKYGDMKTAATKNDGVVQFVLFVYVVSLDTYLLPIKVFYIKIKEY